MGTRSVIAKQNSDGTITGVYCHWDGYIDHNGKILFNNYSDETKLDKLIEQGGISSLRSRIGTKHSFDDGPKNETTFYHRDRGDALCVHSWKRIQNMVSDMDGCEFFYLWKDGEWLVSEGGEFNLLRNFV